jgi:hypothetical protein
MVLALLLLSQLPSPVVTAEGHLQAGKLDDVLFDLDGTTLGSSDKVKAVDLLGRAGQAALTRKDAVLALQFAQMGLRIRPEDVGSLEVAARSTRIQQQYGAAIAYADRWLKESRGGARACLFRAELATDDGDWDKCVEIATAVVPADLSKEDQQGLSALVEACRAEASARQAGRLELAGIEEKIDSARQRASGTLFAVRSSSPLVYCIDDAHCRVGERCSPVVVASNRLWKQMRNAPPNCASHALDDSEWELAVEEGAHGGVPWGVLPEFPLRTPARWIWFSESRSSGDAETAYFRARFLSPVRDLDLSVAVDNGYEIYVDGTKLGSGHDWHHANHFPLEVTPGVQHQLAVRAINDGGPGGVLLEARASVSFCQADPLHTK